MSTNPIFSCVASTYQHVDGVVVVRCLGELDTLTVPHLESEIALALQGSPTVLIVDLSEVTFLASCAMGALLTAHENCSATASFVVVAEGRATSRPMELIGLTAILDVRPTVADALEGIAGTVTRPA